MGNQQDGRLLNELKQTVSDVKSGSGQKDTLWKEDAESFSTESLDFVQVSTLILEETEDLFAFTRTCDRFAPEYLQLCDKLLKAVHHLGSVYITKTALIQRKFPVKGLETLTAERLNRMVSFNLLKCKAALAEIKKTRHDYDQNYFSMMLRFAAASERLRVTQYRAYNINLWMIEPHKDAEQGLSFGKQDGNRQYDREYSGEAVPFRNAGSFALRYDVLQEAADQHAAPGQTEDADPDAEKGLIISAAAPADEPLQTAEFSGIIESEPASVENEIEVRERDLTEELINIPASYLQAVYGRAVSSAGSEDGKNGSPSDAPRHLRGGP